MIHRFHPEQAHRSWSWVTLSGPDAQDFLHRLTTVHVRALQPGEGSPGCFLNAQGKVRAYFSLWHFAPNDYAFELDTGQDGEWKKELLAAIDQYTFAEKITLTDVAPLATHWLFADAQDASQLLSSIGAPDLRDGQTLALEEEVRVCHHGERDYGRTWLSVWGRPARLTQWLDSVLPPEKAQTATWQEVESWRISSGRPRVGTEITPNNTIPLEVGLFDAIATDKGCYPGQEVIERIVSLGSPARRLCRIEGQGNAPLHGQKLVNLAEPPTEVGEITSMTEHDGRFTALGFVRKIHAKPGLDVRLANSDVTAQITQVAEYRQQVR